MNAMFVLCRSVSTTRKCMEKETTQSLVEIYV